MLTKQMMIDAWKNLPDGDYEKRYIIVSTKEMDYRNELYGTDYKNGDHLGGNVWLFLQDEMPKFPLKIAGSLEETFEKYGIKR